MGFRGTWGHHAVVSCKSVLLLFKLWGSVPEAGMLGVHIRKEKGSGPLLLQFVCTKLTVSEQDRTSFLFLCKGAQLHT